MRLSEKFTFIVEFISDPELFRQTHLIRRIKQQYPALPS